MFLKFYFCQKRSQLSPYYKTKLSVGYIRINLSWILFSDPSTQVKIPPGMKRAGADAKPMCPVKRIKSEEGLPWRFCQHWYNIWI